MVYRHFSTMDAQWEAMLVRDLAECNDHEQRVELERWLKECRAAQAEEKVHLDRLTAVSGEAFDTLMQRLQLGPTAAEDRQTAVHTIVSALRELYDQHGALRVLSEVCKDTDVPEQTRRAAQLFLQTWQALHHKLELPTMLVLDRCVHFTWLHSRVVIWNDGASLETFGPECRYERKGHSPAELVDLARQVSARATSPQ